MGGNFQVGEDGMRVEGKGVKRKRRIGKREEKKKLKKEGMFVI